MFLLKNNKNMRILLLGLLCVGGTLAQYAPTTPVPILKQINRHNEDGSYSYGFEAADGSYKIESKYPTGEVFGKYGFIDDTGNLREIEYGATKQKGFEPHGSGINIPPVDNSLAAKDDGDDGQYREDPSIYHTDPKYTNGEHYEDVPKQLYAHRAQLSARPISHNLPISKPTAIASLYQPGPSPSAVPLVPLHQAPALQYKPIQEYQPYYKTQHQPAAPPPQYHYAQPQAHSSQLLQSKYIGYPLHNIGIDHGSYTVNYRR